ncbi:MAG: hypothetical protein AVO34_09260 [Firmicutes bacterium ML8_F2]|jgi:hypothetical protein|nr:MAG: hypothetical protein AVO34_09260 [Firmicutes bacterium ML8_F2]
MAFKIKFALVLLIVALMFVLHNSFWLWELDDRISLFFGFMPFAFFYYVGYALLAFGAMRLIINLAWPDPSDKVLASFPGEETVEK